MSKRFKEPKQITDLIDRYRKEIDHYMNDAAEDDKLADHLRDTKESWRIERLRSYAEQKRNQASWRETRIKNLSDSLSVLMTPQLPGVEGDSSIPTS